VISIDSIHDGSPFLYITQVSKDILDRFCGFSKHVDNLDAIIVFGASCSHNAFGFAELLVDTVSDKGDKFAA
jgi:hypothetical protein